MGIQAFVPSGGGGTPGFDYIASVRMETYNRSWAQAGAAGNYILTSNNNSNGYAYFVGSVTVGIPLGQVVNLTEPFTRIDIVAPQGDYISLNKVAVKSTTLFANPLAAFASFPSFIQTSGNFVLPNNALPLINVLIAGGGGGGGGNGGHGGGGGGGGGVVKLNAYQAIGTTSITIGSGGGVNGKGGNTYFGNVYAWGGGAGADHNSSAPTHDGLYANGGGGGGWGGTSGAAGVQMTSTQFGTKGSPTYHGGYRGGNNPNDGDVHRNRGGGGGGAGGNGNNGGFLNGSNNTQTNGINAVGGLPHQDSTHDNRTWAIGAGGWGRSHYNSPEQWPTHTGDLIAHGGHGSGSHHGNASGGGTGAVIVRYYIP